MGKLLVLMVVAFVDMVGLVMLLPLLPYYATQHLRPQAPAQAQAATGS